MELELKRKRRIRNDIIKALHSGRPVSVCELDRARHVSLFLPMVDSLCRH